jgi:hypothetical protein
MGRIPLMQKKVLTTLAKINPMRQLSQLFQSGNQRNGWPMMACGIDRGCRVATRIAVPTNGMDHTPNAGRQLPKWGNTNGSIVATGMT